MDKSFLISLKNKISSLSDEDKIERDKYLKGISTGEIYGPSTGYSSIDKPWLKYYDDEIFSSFVPNMSAYDFLMYENSENMGNNALYYFGKKYSYTDLKEKIAEVEKSFRSLGVKKGDIVSVAIPNGPENVFVFYALNKIGATVNMIDPRIKDEMLTSLLNDTDSKIMVGCDLFAENIANVVDNTCLDKVIMTSPSISLPPIVKQLYSLNSKVKKVEHEKFEDWNKFISRRYDEDETLEQKTDEDTPACILYTSGTTGKPKGVVLTNKVFNNMAVQYQNIGMYYNENDKFMNQVPPFLAYNTILSTHMPLCMGFNIVMFPNYEPENFAKNVMKYKINHVLAGPADWSNFLENPKVKKGDLSHLYTMGSGSAKLSEPKKEEINKLIHERGGKYKILEGYGMTEVGSAACSALPNINIPNSVGVPLPKMTIGIFEEDSDNELMYGQEGDICITGPTVMKEYFDNEEATNETLIRHSDGTYWIHTNDIGCMDDEGRLYLKGRKSRNITRYDGIKISPYDIENVIEKIDDVNDCCVVAVDDLEHGSGSVPHINVVQSEESLLSEEELKSLVLDKCNEKLSSKYCIGAITVRDELPLTPVGKTDFRKLSDMCNKENKGLVKQKVL